MPKMFTWRSEALKQYAPGKLVVLAENVEEARLKIRAQIDPWIREHREWALPEYNADDEDDYIEIVAQFEADIAADPEEHEVLFINGSE